jgi:hypothetical protein
MEYYTYGLRAAFGSIEDSGGEPVGALGLGDMSLAGRAHCSEKQAGDERTPSGGARRRVW